MEREEGVLIRRDVPVVMAGRPRAAISRTTKSAPGTSACSSTPGITGQLGRASCFPAGFRTSGRAIAVAVTGTVSACCVRLTSAAAEMEGVGVSSRRSLQCGGMPICLFWFEICIVWLPAPRVGRIGCMEPDEV